MKYLSIGIAIAISCIFLLSPPTVTQVIAMEPANMRSLIKQAADAWIAGDGDAIAALFVPDGEFIVPGKRWVGQAEIRESVTLFALGSSDVKINIQRMLFDGDRAVVEWHWENTEKATGLRYQADDAIAIDFQQNRISRWREYIDAQTPKLK